MTATNGAGSLAAETAALAISYVAPALVGELFDEVFDQGVGAETIATAQVFAGEALSFAAEGLGVTIDPLTGVLTVSTDAALSGETVTVTATNSGGSAAASFLLTVEAEALPAFPPMVADGAWAAAEVRDVAPAGRRRAEIPRPRRRSRASSPPGSGAGRGHRQHELAPGDAAGRDLHHQQQHEGRLDLPQPALLAARRRRRLGAGLEPGRVRDQGARAGDRGAGDARLPGGGYPSASATQDALKAALDARIAGGSTGDWIIDLPSGFYGNLSLNERKLPGKTILRSPGPGFSERSSPPST